MQGFEAARYIGVRFSGEQRISGMRLAQFVSTAVFVTLVAALLVLFLPPTTKTDGTAIFLVSDEIGDSLPWLLVVAAIGSQTAAILGAASSRSDMLVSAKVPRWLTFLIILVPAIVLIFVADIAVAVNIASRVFAAYFMIQALLAGILARRAGSWGAVAGFQVIGPLTSQRTEMRQRAGFPLLFDKSMERGVEFGRGQPSNSSPCSTVGRIDDQEGLRRLPEHHRSEGLLRLRPGPCVGGPPASEPRRGVPREHLHLLDRLGVGSGARALGAAPGCLGHVSGDLLCLLASVDVGGHRFGTCRHHLEYLLLWVGS